MQPGSSKPVAQSESDTNLTGPSRRLAGAGARCRHARAAGRGRAPFPPPIRLDALPQRHRQGRRHLDRGCGRPPLHGFPRQQRPSHRLRPSAPEARPSPSRWMRCRSRRAATPASRRSRWPRSSARSRPIERGQGALHDRRVGRHRGGGQDRARGDRPVQDAVVLGRLPWRRLRRFGAVGRGAVPLGPGRAAWCRAPIHVAPFGGYRCPYGTSNARSIGRSLRAHDRLRAGARGRCRRPRRRADPRRALYPAARLLGAGARGLRPARRAAGLRRDSDRPRQDRRACSPASTMASCPTFWCSARRSAAASCRSPPCWPGPSSTSARDWAFGHYTHEKNPVTARAALTTIEIIEDEGLVENAARVGALALERLERVAGAQSGGRRRARPRPADRRRTGARRALARSRIPSSPRPACMRRSTAACPSRPRWAMC